MPIEHFRRCVSVAWQSRPILLSVSCNSSYAWWYYVDIHVVYTTIRLPNLLINRLYLNLRTWNLPPASVSNHSGLGEPAFAQNRFLGSIGEPLDPDWWNTQFDDGDDTGPDGSMADASETTDIGDRNTTLVPVVRILLLSDYAEKHWNVA